MTNNNKHVAPDVSPKANRDIWIYFILLGILLFITIGGLTIYFRFQVQYEKNKKIGEVITQEMLDYKSFYQPIILGQKGILENKKYISVNDAMKQVLNNIRIIP